MKRLVMVALVLIFAVACDDDNPNSPSDSNTRRFTAILLPQNEVPPVTNADAGASGTMQLTMTVTRDGANAITGATYDFTVNITGFPAPTTLTGAHIHPGAANATGGVIVPLSLTSTDVAVTTGQATITKPNQAAGANQNAATVAQGIWDNPGGHYFNVHTTLNPPGAIRGQLVRID
jgi:hypothetical protein